MEQALAADFTFTSPFDDHIDLAAWWKRCWPQEPLHQQFSFVAVAQDGCKVSVIYDATMHVPNAVHPAARFRNAELLTFREGKLASVEVFFGDPPSGLSRHQFAVQCGAG